MIFWGVLSILLVYKDYLLFGGEPVFKWLLLLRIGFAILTVAVVYLVIFFANQRPLFDCLVFFWVTLAVIVPVTIYEIRPFVDESRYLVDLVVIFSFYFFIPNHLLVRVIPPLLFSIYDVAQMLFNRGNYSPHLLVAVVFSFAVANSIGFLLSINAFSKQHKEKIARLEEDRVRVELERLASTDSLTGVYNRRRQFEIAGEAFYRFHRYLRPFTIVVMDLDGFKKINDTFGHQQGDSTLIEFTRMVCSEKRETDTLGRMGGDEFCLVLPETNYAEAAALGERILHRCADLTINQNSALSFSVTVSIGISEICSLDKSLDNLFSRADTALYSAKNNGKNRCVVAFDPQHVMEDLQPAKY